MKQINAQVMKSSKVHTLSASHAIFYTEHLAEWTLNNNIIYNTSSQFNKPQMRLMCYYKSTFLKIAYAVGDENMTEM